MKKPTKSARKAPPKSAARSKARPGAARAAARKPAGKLGHRNTGLRRKQIRQCRRLTATIEPAHGGPEAAQAKIERAALVAAQVFAAADPGRSGPPVRGEECCAGPTHDDDMADIRRRTKEERSDVVGDDKFGTKACGLRRRGASAQFNSYRGRVNRS